MQILFTTVNLVKSSRKIGWKRGVYTIHYNIHYYNTIQYTCHRFNFSKITFLLRFHLNNPTVTSGYLTPHQTRILKRRALLEPGQSCKMEVL